MQDSSNSPDTGRRIGRYHLLRKLGEGGMGAVWLAEQHEPVQRMVALKLIRAGMDSESVVSRFSSERQALALMQHPAIAHVFDAGTTPDGAPYFVMEHIEGVPITEYCDSRRLSIRQRLELFITICDGVQHAHQKAILHRDLKPSNVLVMEQDGKPAVKIIDFGLAKAIGVTPGQIAQTTLVGEVVGTPRYMSPEQLDFSPDGVDTRTDVYSLGVMLYELLTGTTPHSDTRAFDELLSQIREGDVAPPSSRFTEITDSSSEAAGKCGGTVETVRKQLSGDLDWISVKSLATDREQRYSSASEFAADIGRYLRDEPVLARRPSTSYRIAKFVKRNKVSVALAALVATLVIGLAITMTVQTLRIARERDRANHEAETTRNIARFLTDMFDVANPNESQGSTVTAREILDKASREIQTNLSQSPEVRGQLMHTMANAYIGLGLPKQAKPLLEEAIRLQSQTLGSENRVTMRSMSRLGYVLRYVGQPADSEELLVRTLDTQRRVLGADDEDPLETAGYLAETLSMMGRSAETETVMRETIRVQSKLLGPEHGDTLRSQRVLSWLLWDQRKNREAEQQMQATLATHRRVFGPEHPSTLYEANLLGLVLTLLHRYPEAEQLLRTTLEAQKRVSGPTHTNTIAVRSNLALVLTSSGRAREAVPLAREAVAMHVKLFGPDHPDTLNTQHDLAGALGAAGDHAEAETVLRAVLVVKRRVLPLNHPRLIEGIFDLGAAVSRQGRHTEARKFYEEALRLAKQPGATDPGILGRALLQFAAGEALAGRRQQALDLLEQAVGSKSLDPVGNELSGIDELKSLRGDARFEALAARLRSQK